MFGICSGFNGEHLWSKHLRGRLGMKVILGFIVSFNLSYRGLCLINKTLTNQSIHQL